MLSTTNPFFVIGMFARLRVSSLSYYYGNYCYYYLLVRPKGGAGTHGLTCKKIICKFLFLIVTKTSMPNPPRDPAQRERCE